MVDTTTLFIIVVALALIAVVIVVFALSSTGKTEDANSNKDIFDSGRAFKGANREHPRAPKGANLSVSEPRGAKGNQKKLDKAESKVDAQDAAEDFFFESVREGEGGGLNRADGESIPMDEEEKENILREMQEGN